MDRNPDRDVIYPPTMNNFDVLKVSSDLPNPSAPKLLRHCSWGKGGPFQCLFHFCDTRYNFILEYNATESENMINNCLRKIHQGLAQRDYKVMDEGVSDCFEVIFSFLKSEHDGRMKSRLGEKGEEVVQILIKSEEGSMKISHHDRELSHNFDDNLGGPIKNPFPHLRVLSCSEIECSKELGDGPSQVKMDGKSYLLKRACQTDPDSFSREFTILATLPHHPNVISLFGVMDACDGKIDALLTPFIRGSTLKELSSATSAQKIAWKKQMTEAVNFLHDNKAVWGDAAVQNVMIDQLNDRVVLIDFGGGITRGWIDDDRYETKEGDLQALERLHLYIDTLKEPHT